MSIYFIRVINLLKYKIYVLLLFLVSLISINIVYANNSLELVGRVIYIDPGHGGADPGATYKNIKESDINLEISLKLKRELEKNGAIVYITRDKNIDLSSNKYSRKRSDIVNRIKLINDSDCDLYLSIHLNSETSSVWYGGQVFYDDVNPSNIVLAEEIQKQLKKNTNTKRDIEEIKDILLNRKINKVGVLVELGFLSNANDRYLLRRPEYQEKLSKSITKGVISYFTR